MKKRVLLILDEAWNDILYGNNNMTNWFDGFDDVELAVIYCSPELPYNNCCDRYFQVTDSMMLKSIISSQRAGKVLDGAERFQKVHNITTDNDIMSKIKNTHLEIFRLCRDLIWLFGKYDMQKLSEFIDDFKPDVIFSQRMATVKLCRLEKIVKNAAKCPMMVYTGDNEYSLAHFNFSPIFWIRKFMLRRALEKNMKFYSKYYTASQEQADFYKEKFNVKTDLLFKCADYLPDKVHKKVNTPIQMVYAGKLYCGRADTLAALAEAARQVNKDGCKIVLNIYTRDKVTKKQRKQLDDGVNSVIHGAAAPSDLQRIYDEADIALHVEAFDLKNRLITRHSYSTKVIDCLQSGCAVMAIGWEKHSACVLLKKSDAAFVITSSKSIEAELWEIIKDSSLITEYAAKGMRNILDEHSKNKIQDKLMNDFITIR